MESRYWQGIRSLRKKLIIGLIISKELIDTIWVIYGITQFWGEGSRELRKGKC